MSEDDFECESCHVMFSAPLYDISWSSEKMVDTPDEPYPFLMDIRGAVGFANFCSSTCRDKGRVAVMAAQGVSSLNKPKNQTSAERCEQTAYSGEFERSPTQA